MVGDTTDGGATAKPREDGIFVSYAHADSNIVGDLVSHLGHAGFHVWWDKRLLSGDAYGLVIEDKISAASAVLVFWSAAARRSVWVFGEASAGHDDGKLVQATLDFARPPVPFNAIHFVDLAGWPRDASALVGELIDAVRSLGDAPPSQAQRAPAHSAVWQTGWTVAGLAAAAPAIAVGALLGIQTDAIGADVFSTLGAISFVASSAAVVAAVRAWFWFDTKEPTLPVSREAGR